MGWPLALAVGFSVPGLAQTLPQGGNVVGGAGTITQTAPNQLTINQASQNLAIDWQSFSIGANNIVRFVQPSTSAVALNRMLNGDPSQIYGQIQANGQVVIMSPNGIVFGPNSRIDVNALVATTANISTLDFMAGKLLFDQASSDANARVVNQGIISVAQGGFAVLAAANVSNQGQIIANGGTVVLGGTKTFAIDFHGDGLLKFAATGAVDQKPTGADALVENSGSIEANGGRVLLTARAARSVLDNVINTTGIVVARTASLVNGEIVIDGGDSGIVHVAGTLDASGAAAGESGGTVKVLGEKVGLFENARIDASGTAGGGTVLVGGNYQGMGPEANAQYLYMDARAVIDASSASGDGGRVILWSDLATRNAGHINVSGARDGGFIEVSSKGFLDFRGTVDLRGLSGRAGELLLDPTDITISSSSSSGDMSGVSPFVGSNASSNLDVAVLNAALAGGDVTVTTASAGAGTGNIDVTATIANSVAGRTLTLRADGAITVGTGGYISSGGYLFNVSLRAAGNITVGGTGIVTNGGNLTTESVGGGGQAGGNFVSTANINAGTGNVTLAHAGTISIGAAINTTGQLSINAGGATTQTAAITGPASLVIGGTGAVTLANAGNSFSNITLGRTGTTTDVSIVNAISGNFQTSTLGSGTFTYSSATAGFLQSGGITQDAGGGAVSISGGTGAVTLGQANSFSGPVTVTGDTITVSAAQSATGAGSISLQATRNVVVSANLTTAGGDILITGNVSSWVTPTVSAPTYAALSGSFDGVVVNAGVSITTGANGNIAIAGMGGDTGANQHGVRMYAAAATPTTIATTGAGTITLYGRGGLSTANAGGGLGGSHGGFRFDGDATGVVDVSTVNGNIKMVGAGGGVGVTSDNNGGGVFFHTKVRATGTGSIDIAGTPGVGASIGLAAFFAQTEISAVSGDIALTGTSGAAFVNDGAFAGSASGLRIGGATVRTTGTGNVTLRGIDGTEGPGILISDVNGTSTLGNAAMNGDLTLRANSLTYTGTNTITNSGSGRIIFRTDTDATTIGVAGGAGTLQVPTSILSAATGFFNAQIGSISQTGTITAGAGWTLARSTTLLTGTGNATVASVALAGNQLTFNAGGTVSQTGAISGAGSVYLAGAGNTTLNNGGNSFTDLSFQMTGTAGNVNIATTGALFVGSSTIGTGTLSLTGAGFSQGGTGIVQDAGGGAVTIAGGAGAVALSRANSWTGDFTATGATVAVSAAQTLARVGSQNFSLTGTNGNVLIQADVAKTNAGAAAMSIAAFETAWFANAGLSSNGGAITIWGNAPGGSNSGGASAGTAWGVRIDGASAVISAGAGAISIVGKGSTDSGSGQHGIAMINGGSVQTTTGAIAMQGRGGDGTATGQLGIVLANSTVQSSSGTVTLTGWGGANSSDSHAIYVDAGGSVASATGNVTLDGTAPTATAVYIFGGSVSTGGSGTLTLQGSAASGTGIEGGTGSTITTGTGALTLVSDRDVSIANTLLTTGGALDVTATGSINLSNASNSIGGNTTINATGSTSNVNFRNTSASQNLNVSSTGYLDLNDLTVTGDLTASAVGVLTVNTPFGMAAGRNATLTATGIMSSIQILGEVTLSNGNFSAVSGRGIVVNASVATNGGDIVMYGNAPGGNVNTGTGTGTFSGVQIDGAIIVNAGGGNIDIRGRAGDSGSHHGVTIRNGAGVLTSGSGTLDIMGHGGTSTGGGSSGIEFYASGAYAQTQDGALTVTGYGSTGGGNNNPGVALATGEIRATGTGTVAVSGAGGAGGSTGVSVQGGGTTLISTTNGNLTVIGNGGSGSGGGFESWGVNVAGQSGQGDIQSTGTGNITVTGTAGATSGNDRYGVIIGSGGSIVATSAAGGTLNVTGTGGPGTGTDNHGIYLTGAGATIWGTGFSVVLSGTGGTSATSSDGIRFDSGANTHSDDGLLTLTGVGTGGGYGIAATGTGSTIGDPASAGNINLIADTVSMSAATLDIETDGQVLIRPVNAATTIGIGGGAGTLQLPSDMSFVDAALLVVGDPSAGAIEVGAGGVSTATGTDLGLRGASIALTGDVTLGAVDTLTLYANTGGVTQAAGSTISAANLVLRGAGDFAVNRAGTGYNNITNVAADVTAGSGTGAIVLYTGAGGGSSANALTDGVGTVNGISTPGGLTWVALNGLTQTGAGVISVGGVTNLTAQNGTMDLSAAPNTFSGQVAATSAGGGSILLTASTLALGIVNSAGNVILSATSGGINQAGLLTANGNLNASTNGGPLALSSYQNVVLGSVSLATSGGANNIAWTQSGPMLVGSISSSGQLNLSVTGGGISQVGTISTGGATILSVDTGNIALTNAANAFVGPIEATNTAGDISIANTGNTVFGDVVSNGVLNISVTGGTLTQLNATAITTTGNATLTLAGAYAMTLTESGNNVGGNLALSGSTGTLDGTLGGTVAVTAGSFVVNGVTYTAAAPPPTNNTTPAPGAGVGGTTVSSALTDAAPISQIQGAAALPPPPPPGAAAAGSSALALLTGGPGPLVAGGPGAPGGPAGPAGPAEGGEGGPAVSPVGVVSAPPPPPAAAAPGAPAPVAPGAPPPPAIVTSGGPPPGPGAPPLVPTTAPPPAVTAVGNVGGASAPAVNGGAVQPTSSAPQTAVTSPFPSMSF